MKHNKKFLSCIIACALTAIPLAACGHDSGISDNTPDTNIEYIYGSGPENSSDPQAPETSPSDVPTTAPESTPPTEIGGNEPNPDIPDDTETENGNETPTVTPDPIVTPTTKSVDYIRVAVNGLNIRSGPGTSYSSLGTVESGVLLKLEEKCGDFYKTAYLNRTAYVSANPAYTSVVSIAVEEPNEDIERIIDEGLKVLGTEYVFGAVRYHYGNGTRLQNFTVTQFDCSSLMQYIFYMGANRLLDMTSRAQSLQGAAVDKSDIKRGDLLFFTNASRFNNTGLERIGHVALYLGDNYILHTASDYAKVEQISATRWSYYITARRIV